MDMEDWITENAALIMEAARPFIGMGMEYDDLSQEAMLAACCAYRKYDKTRKWSMSSWVYYNVRHHLLKKLGEEAQYRLNVMADDTAVVASLQQINRCFENMVYVNFEEDKALAGYLEVKLTPAYIIKVIEEQYGVKIFPQKTLIIFDEIQSCEHALTSLKYFAEQAPEYCVVAAGSLLGVAINRQQYSFPVGKVQLENLYPLDLEEYLWARDKDMLVDLIRQCYATNKPLPETLHKEALNFYEDYLLTGGMPAVVAAALNDGDADELKRLIYNSYVADMAKYAGKGDSVKIAEAYDSLPVQLARENNKFQYKLIRTGARSSQAVRYFAGTYLH